MRTCASFLVVEYMRHGMDVQEACSKAIQRVMKLKPPPQQTMHSTLVVAVLAMDKNGKV
jgi:isoaspartyl peptidase/L-asparaginase-like protein (Ntn-hydrolase superfamily)